MTHVVDAAYTADGLIVLTPDGVFCKGPDGRWIKAASLPLATPVRLVAKDFDTFSIVDNGNNLWQRIVDPASAGFRPTFKWQRVIDLPESQP